ncbi:MAG: sulfatase-like hydrolase/transferase [Candidatus Micrarchaeota archaeon]|nr:sulfatase-like hydrolase/transferase [Candidatus Micrarchaeota archaeon]
MGELIGTLRSRGVYDDTMVIITSDHGQAFNEHGFMYHGTYLYDEIVRIPLIIKYPHGRRFRKRPGCQSLCNIFPLIRDILDGKDDRRVTTGSAFAEAYGNTEHIPKAYSHMMPYIEKTYEKVRKAVYTDSGKMTFNDTDGTIEELYDGKREIDPNGSKAKGLAKTLSTELNRFGKRDGFRVSA